MTTHHHIIFKTYYRIHFTQYNCRRCHVDCVFFLFSLVFSVCVFLFLSLSFSLLFCPLPFAENEDDTLNNQVDQDSSTILNECKRDASKRRPSLAQKMTSNLRRLSGATELKIDINDSISANNSKYCNKKIKVSIQQVGTCGM